MTMTKNQGFTLVELLVVIGILGILSAALFPAIGNAVLKANMTAVGTRGKDIYVAVIGANTEREPLGLGNIWPKKALPVSTSGDGKDISEKQYSSTSSEYFNDLLDGENFGSAEWAPYVQGLDFSKLSGAGVPARPAGQGPLQPANNMWSVCVDIRDELEDVIPFLVTRNVKEDSSVLKATIASPSTTRLTKDQWRASGPERTQPFSDKGFVIVRKGGAIFTLTARYVTEFTLYQGQSFDTAAGGGQAISYLHP